MGWFSDPYGRCLNLRVQLHSNGVVCQVPRTAVVLADFEPDFILGMYPEMTGTLAID